MSGILFFIFASCHLLTLPNTQRDIFYHNIQSIVNLKLKFWDYNEKNMGFHLTHKKYYF